MKKRSVVLHDNDELHVETPLGIINIRTGLTDLKLRKVESIAVSPNNYQGENKIRLSGYPNTRLIQLKSKQV